MTAGPATVARTSILGGEGGADEAHHLRGDADQVEGLAAGLTLAAELEDLLHQVPAASCHLERLLQIASGREVGRDA